MKWIFYNLTRMFNVYWSQFSFSSKSSLAWHLDKLSLSLSISQMKAIKTKTCVCVCRCFSQARDRAKRRKYSRKIGKINLWKLLWQFSFAEGHIYFWLKRKFAKPFDSVWMWKQIIYFGHFSPILNRTFTHFIRSNLIKMLKSVQLNGHSSALKEYPKSIKWKIKCKNI